MGFVSRLCRYLAEAVLVLAIIMFVPGIPPHAEFTYEMPAPTLPREGPLSSNKILDSAERLFENTFIGPESVASRGRENEIFVSMHGGSIVKVYGPNYTHFKEVAKIGPGCRGPWEERICGRPLGLRFAKDGRLLVADAYLGIFKVDVDTGNKERLMDPSQPIAGKRPLLVDDLDEDAQGNIYWSDASSLVNLSDGILEGLAGPTGRLFRLDASTGHSLLLLDKLLFANGVQLSPKEDFVLVCDTFRSRVLRYWLQGPKTGTSDVFVEGLPGFPDNVRPRPGGGYYVSLVSVKKPNAIDLINTLAQLPWLRRLLSRLLCITKSMIDGITYLYDNQYTARIAFNLCMTGSYTGLSGNRAMVVLLNETGGITGSLQGESGAVAFISETAHVGDKLFFGSPYNNYLGMLSLDKLEDNEKDTLSGQAKETPVKEEL